VNDFYSQVIKCLKRVARKHQITIVTSIHQPNADVLMMFDYVYVLAKGGKCVFSDMPSKLAIHLHDSGINFTEWQIPIEVLLKIASKGENDAQKKRLYQRTFLKCASIMDKCKEEAVLKENGIEFKAQNFSINDFWNLLERNSLCFIRSQWKLLLIQLIYFLSFIGTLSQMFNPDMGKANGCFSLTPNGNATTCGVQSVEEIRESTFLIQNGRNVGFTLIVLFFLETIFTTVAIPGEVKIFLNEHANGWYSSGSFYWSKSLIELPFIIMIGVIIALVSFFGTKQLEEDSRLIGYIYFFVIGSLISQGIGFVCGIVFAHEEMLAAIVAIGWYLLSVVGNGFFVPIHKMHVSIRIFSHLSWLKHSFFGTILVLYGNGRCEKNEMQIFMHQFNLNDDDLLFNMGGSFLHFIVYRILALIGLIYVAKRQKN
jgi:ABC-2 type transporter